MHRSHGLQGSLKRRYKHPSPTSINGYHTAKSSCRNRLQNGPRSLSRAKVGTRSAFGEKSHTRAHTAKQVAFWVGVVSLPSERFTRFGNPAWPGIRTANFAPFGSRSRVLPKNAESLRDSDALMRVAVPQASRPRWAALLCLQFGDVAVFSLCAQGFPHMQKRGWYHYPRSVLHILETPDGRLSKRLICHFPRSGGYH